MPVKALVLNVNCVYLIVEFDTDEKSLASDFLNVRKCLELLHKVSADSSSVTCKVAAEKFVDLSESCGTADRMSAECRSVRACREGLGYF